MEPIGEKPVARMKLRYDGPGTTDHGPGTRTTDPGPGPGIMDQDQGPWDQAGPWTKPRPGPSRARDQAGPGPSRAQDQAPRFRLQISGRVSCDPPISTGGLPLGFGSTLMAFCHVNCISMYVSGTLNVL